MSTWLVFPGSEGRKGRQIQTKNFSSDEKIRVFKNPEYSISNDIFDNVFNGHVVINRNILIKILHSALMNNEITFLSCIFFNFAVFSSALLKYCLVFVLELFR